MDENKILDGKAIAEKWLLNIKNSLYEYKDLQKLMPRLDVIQVGDDFASTKYVTMKSKTAKELGFEVNIHRMEDATTTDQLVNVINSLNEADSVDGIMVQLPLPKHIDKYKVLNSIFPNKDVDGLSAYNLGSLYQGRETLASATAVGVMQLLKEYNIKVSRKNVVIVGSTPLVGFPLHAMLINEGATVTMCHVKTRNLPMFTRNAEILISAVGKAKLITADHVKHGAIVIDVGVSKDPDTGKLSGDVDFENVVEKALAITPVPGGVGPMTIAALMSNLHTAWMVRQAHHRLVRQAHHNKG